MAFGEAEDWWRKVRVKRLTVEQVFVVGLVIQITAVLLDGIDAELGRVDGLGTQVVGLQIAANDAAALLLSGSFGPESLDVGTLCDKIPRRIRLPSVLLGLDQWRESVEGVGCENGDFIPHSPGIIGHLAKDGLIFLHLVGPVGSGAGDDLLGLVRGSAEDLLYIVLQVEGGGGAGQQSCRGGNPHRDSCVMTQKE